MEMNMDQVLKQNYKSLQTFVEQNLVASITVAKQRNLFIQLGKMAFIYDFARGNNIDTSWAIKGGVIFHEFYIKKHFLGYDASTLASTEADKKKQQNG